MNCDDVAHAIYVYLDDEFAIEDKHEFEEHLHNCPRCRRAAEGERLFLKDLRQRLDAPPAPSALRENVVKQLAAMGPIERPVEKSDSRVWQAVLAAALVLTAVVLVLTNSERTGPVSVKHEALAAHQNALPLEIKGSEEAVRRFAQDNVRFAVELPLASSPKLRLIGARLGQIGGQSAVLFLYDYDGRRVSVLQTSAPRRNGIERPEFGHHEGYNMVTYRRRGVTNSIVGAVPDQELPRLLPAAFRP